MAQYLFGAGKIFATPLQDVHGNPITNGTPVEVGVLQSTSVDISYDLKELYGRGQFAVDAARGKGSIKCKATMGRINGALLNSIFFGGVVTEGGITAVAQTINGEVVAAFGKCGSVALSLFVLIEGCGVLSDFILHSLDNTVFGQQ